MSGSVRLVLAAATALALTACGSPDAPPLVHRGDTVPVPSGPLRASDVALAQTRFGSIS